MGQKVHPKGLRLGIIYNWSSRWFFSDKNKFRNVLISDINLREKLMKKMISGGVVNLEIERTINKITLIFYSVKPGVIIGRGGKGLEDLKNEIIKILKIDKNSKDIKIEIKIEPVKKPYLNAYYVAQTIAEKIVKNFPHRSVVHNAINRVIEAGAKGIKIRLAGRIAGTEIARQEKYFQGTVPMSTIRENIDYAECPALTKSGYVGVKVWICH